MNIKEKLNKIQVELKAPKNQVNSFGHYKYRNCEDVLEGLKPLLEKYKVILKLSDEVKQFGDRYYIAATAKLFDCEKDEHLEVLAYAREPQERKGMDEAQVTGATSSYARKYALNGLFAIDDSKDADSQDNSQQQQPVKARQPVKAQTPVTPVKPVKKINKLDQTRIEITRILKKLNPLLDTKKEYEKFAKSNTGLDLIETNFDEILDRLIILKKDMEGNK